MFFAHPKRLLDCIKSVNEGDKIPKKQGRVVSVNTFI